ncbi:MAG: hypothetical protein OXB86_06175 [Bdellovibrionales bacterium]|nr:hypothetical protein [Bdellovibrionales bacterium]
MGKNLLFVFILSCFLIDCTINSPPLPRPPQTPYGVTLNPSTAPPGGPQLPSLTGEDPSGTRTQVFPYQINVDTISYMGCPEPSATDPIFTSFKLGAYSKGVQLTDEFKNEIKQYDNSQKRTVLRDSPLINSRGQVTVSHRGDIRIPVSIKNQPLISYFPSINDPITLTDLAEKGVSQSIGINNSFEVILPIPGSILHNILSYLASSHHIALTYNNGSNPQPLGPGLNQYHGRSYQISFDRNLRYMEDIDEYDLLTRKQGKRWNCADNHRLVILRHAQISEEFYLRAKNWHDYYKISREAVCIEDRNALARVGRKAIEDLLPENLFAVGFVHTWERQGESQVLEKTDTPCLTTQTAHWSCYSNSSTSRVEFDERDCKINDEWFKCPSYFSFCTGG